MTAVRTPDRPTRPAAPAGWAVEPAAEGWWDDLSAGDRETALRVARCGGFLPTRLARSLIAAGVLILMPDDVRRYLQHQALR